MLAHLFRDSLYVCGVQVAQHVPCIVLPVERDMVPSWKPEAYLSPVPVVLCEEFRRCDVILPGVTVYAAGVIDSVTAIHDLLEQAATLRQTQRRFTR